MPVAQQRRLLLAIDTCYKWERGAYRSDHSGLKSGTVVQIIGTLRTRNVNASDYWSWYVKRVKMVRLRIVRDGKEVLVRAQDLR
jgi:hypothetical protein